MRANWRDADLRGDAEPAPASVVSVVRAAHLGLSAARLTESLLLSVAGACVCLAALALSGAPLRGVDPWAVALLGGAMVGSSWWFEHRRSLPAVAGALDRRLRHQGALVTAFELERSGERGAMGRWLTRSVCERLRPREARRALLPTIVVPVAAPLAGGALLALALELARPPETASAPLAGELLTGLVGGLDEAAAEALAAGEEDELDPSTVQDLLLAEQAARELLSRDRDEGDATLSELEKLDRELARIAVDVSDKEDLRARIDAARAWLDAASDALRQEGPAGPEDGLDARGGRDGGNGGGGSETGGGGGSPGSAGGELAGGEGSGSRVAPAPMPEAPGLGGRHWGAEYDAIVEGWIESRRAALGRSE